MDIKGVFANAYNPIQESLPLGRPYRIPLN